MLSTPRTHVWMLCLVTLPPMASVYLLKNSHYDLSTPNLLVHLVILALWLFSMNNIVYEHYFGPLSDVPMAGGDWFVLGHTPYIFGNIQGLPYLKLVNNMKLDHRGVFRVKGIFHLGGQLVLTAPETINEALNSHCYDYVKPPKPIAFLSRIIGNGLIASEMAEHKAQRKAVWPAFQGHMIRELVPDMWRKSFEFADVIASETDRETAMLEFNGIVSRATLDIIGVSAFGKDFQTLYNSDNRLASVYKKAFDPTPDIIRYFATSMVLPSFMGPWIPMSGNRKITVDSMVMKEQCAQLIAENRAALKESGDGRPDILSLLLKTDLSDEEILDQMLTFLGAGHETTSSASTFAVYLLATHPDIQHRVRKEVRETLSKYRPEELTMQVLDSMPYLAAVASEALRVWPTVPVTSRVAVKQTTIAGLNIPPGTHVSIAPITIHRLESLWGKDALVFNPDRWLDPSNTVPGGSTHPLAYIPFLTGPRACIGQVFAKAEMRCLLATYVERFQFEMFDPNEELSVAGVITIKPRELKLRITDLGSSLKA